MNMVCLAYRGKSQRTVLPLLLLHDCFWADFSSHRSSSSALLPLLVRQTNSLGLLPIGPGVRASVLLHLSFMCLVEVSGGSREVTGVRLPGPSVCLSNELETQGVSLLWR